MTDQKASENSTGSRFVRFVSKFVSPATFVFFGVLLPAATLIAELVTGMCAEMLNIDPIPTPFHVAAVAAVPVVLGLWGHVRRKGTGATIAWRIAVGVATGISIIYAIPFTPIVPFAIVAAIFGIGLLPLGPFGSAIVGFVALYKMGKESGWQGWWGTAGVVGAFALLTGLAAPQIVMDHVLEEARHGDEAQVSEAIDTLRNFEPATIEPELCRYRKVATPNPISPFSNVFDPDYRDPQPRLFWRVTGETCERVMEREGARGFTRNWRERQKLEPGLSIASSRVDSSVDTVAATAYTEWLYEVNNADTRQREADFIVQLPPGAVVSRVTLWVHGEPREATFAGRGKAEEAYQAVVNRSRDPILVTSVGPDRVRVRMFPVPAGATMKARIGISQPLELERDGHARMQFPHIIDGNLEIDTDHHVWVEAKHPIDTSEIAGFRVNEVDGVHQVRGDVKGGELGDFEIDMQRAPVEQAWTIDGDQFVTQRAGRLEPDPLGHLVVVLDGGVDMRDHIDGLGDAFDQAEADRFTLIVAGDQPIDITSGASISDGRAHVRNLLESFDFIGGRDNAPALKRALELAGPDTTIVWIHAGQPIVGSTILAVPERDKWRIWDLQVDGERDVNVDALHEAGMLHAIPRRGSAAADLETWFESRSSPVWRTERRWNAPAPEHGKETSRHLARIAANERVFELMRAGEHDAAVELAATYQIVTPVSAAIVLETQEQYDEFGLERADGEGVPSIPEPHEWALIIIAVAVLGGAVLRQRRESMQLAGA